MRDTLNILITLAFFALSWLLVRLCAGLQEGEKR